jgi:hypothetical protein
MKRLIGLAALVFAAGCSQIDVKGIVREEGTGEPLPGAAIRVGEHTTTTDLTGYYELEVDEEDGEPQQVHVTKSGYEAYSEQVSFDEDADEVFQDIELQKAAVDPHNPALPQNENPKMGDELGDDDDDDHDKD